MPVVPRISSPQVQQAGMPNARSRVDASAESFGGGQSAANVGQAAQGALGTFQKFVAEEKQKADDVATTEAYTKLVQAKNRLTYDPEVGALSKTGKNAFGVINEYGSSFDKEADAIESELSSQTQKDMFRRIRGQQKSDFDGTLQKHVFGESKKFDEETTTSSIAVTRDDALQNYQDPERINQAIGMQRTLVMSHAARNGLPPEMVKMQLDDVTSKTHAAVVSRFLSNGDDLKAKAYFESNRQGVTGSDASHLEKALEEGSLRGESQRQSDMIIAKTGDMGEALKQAKGIEDPKVRDAATDRVKAHFAAKKAAESERTERLMTNAGNIIDKTGSIDQIPPEQWASLSPSEKSSLKTYAAHKREGTQPATDWQVYSDLKELAADPAMRNQFLQTPLMQYRDKLDDARFVELTNIKSSLRNKDGKAEAEMDGYRNDAQIVKDTLAAAGIKDPAQVALFHSKVDAEMARLQKANNKKASNEDVQRITDNLMVQGITSRTLLGVIPWTTKKKRFETTSDDKEFDVEAKDIPRIERQKIEEALKRRGAPVTDEAVKAWYDTKTTGKKPERFAIRGDK